MDRILGIPKYVRYDFLTTLLGLFLIGSWWYFDAVKKVETGLLGNIAVLGFVLIIWGFGEMYRNYVEETDLSQFRGILEKKKIFDELKKQKVLSDNQHELLINLIKKDIRELIKDHQ